MFENQSDLRFVSNGNHRSRRDRRVLFAELAKSAELEQRQLMTVTVSPLTGTEGLAIADTTTVATFDLSSGLVGNNPGDFSATIFWGDGSNSVGTISELAGNYVVKAGHTYAVGAEYVTQVVVTGKNQTQDSGSGSATIGDIPIVSTSAPIVNAVSSPTISVTGFFTDAYPGLSAADYVSTVSWGDGTTSTATVQGGAGSFSAVATHTYVANGTYPVTVTLARKLDGQSITSQPTNAIIANPGLTLTGLPIQVIQHQQSTKTVATFSDSTPGVKVEDYTAKITWRPGVVSAGIVSGAGGQYSVTGTTTYTTPGNFPILVEIVRKVGAIESASSVSTHATVAPVSSPLLTSTTIQATVGANFDGKVATFQDVWTGLTTANYQATITWPDGTTSQGAISGSAGAYEIKGTFIFASTGSFPIKVDLTRIQDSAKVSTTSTVSVTATAQPQISELTINPVVSTPFSGIVAIFTDSFPGIKESDYTAQITWQTGVVTAGIVKGTNGSFTIAPKDPYTYNSAGTFQVEVELTRNFPFAKVSTTSTAIVSTPVVEIFGTLSPASDTGKSDHDGITNINRPTFIGTAPVGSTVQLLVQWYGQNDQVQVGQGLVDSTGHWSIQTSPMVDGVYSIFVRAISPTGQISMIVPLVGANQTSGKSLVIDTVAPVIASGLINRRSRRVTLSFRDNLSGMDVASLNEKTNYNLFGPHPNRYVAADIGILPNTTILTSDPMISNVDISPSSVGTWRVNGIRVLSGGIRDIAGNALDGDFKSRFPTGNGRPGGLFYWKFSPAISSKQTLSVRKFGPPRLR